MGAIKKHLARPFQASKFGFSHDNADDFYLGWWQQNRASPLPLLVIRGFLFLFSLSILISSLIINIPIIDVYFIYLTHWGLLLITFASAYATLISAIAYFTGPIVQYGIPWYLKVYWVVYNVTISIAFLITVFYWSFLTGSFVNDGESALESYEYNEVLDIFIHGINSVLMFILLITSRHPSRYLHFYQPMLLGVIYVIFTVVYYFTGGLDMFGNPHIYPMLNWEDPWITLGIVVLTALLILVLHIVHVAMADTRDALARLCSFVTNREPRISGTSDVPKV